jgi:uncharacterized protein
VNSIRISRLGTPVQWLSRFADSLALIRRASHTAYPLPRVLHRWRRARLWLRSMLWWHTTTAWLRQCETSPLRDIVQRDRKLFERMHRPFLHGGLSASERLAVSLGHAAITAREAPRLTAQIARYGCRQIARIERDNERWGVTLESLERFGKEGDWTLCIRDSAGHRLVSCTFSFAYLGGNGRRARMCIGSVQGPDSSLDGREMFRTLTKRWHGLRPKVLIVYLAQCVASALKIDARGTLLVSNRAQIYSNRRFCLRKPRLVADYDALSGECGSSAQWQGWNVLPPPERYVAAHLADSGGDAIRRRRHSMRVDLATQIYASVAHGV